jgi:D-alanine-D-alanine ligase
MKGLMNIAVLYGGISSERNVSISSAKSVIPALIELGYNVKPIDPAYGANGLRTLEELNGSDEFPTIEELKKLDPKKILECLNSDLFNDVDLAFIVMHGKYGEDGILQALLELRGIPYTGSNVKASSLAMDKSSSKMLFSAAGLPTPHWTVLKPDDFGNYDLIEEIRDELGSQLVIKPNDQGSTIGITIVMDGNLDDIHHGIIEAGKYSERVLIEEFIEGRELTVGILDTEALPVIEIVAEGGFYDYKHKYTKGHTEYVCPAELTDDITHFAMGLAQTSYMALGCSGFGRVDFRINEDNQPFILEVNTIPGFTSTSLVPKAAKAVGIEFPELCQRLIDITLNKNGNNDAEE